MRTTPAIAALFATALALASCGNGEPTGPGDLVLPPDATRDGLSGNDGSRGAAYAQLTAQARVSESIDAEVMYPADGAANLDHGGAPYPTVVFVQEDGVGVERYRWFAQHLATRGYVTVSPKHSLSQSSYQPDNAVIALHALRSASAHDGLLSGAVRASGPVAVLGHGAGAQTALRAWMAGSFDALGLLAGFPAPGDEPSARAGQPVLDVVGQQDTLRGGLESYTTGYGAFAPPRVLGVVDGMNHYGWTDFPTDRELSGDGLATRDVSAARADALNLIDAWLDAHLRGDGAAGARVDSGAFPGVTVTH